MWTLALLEELDTAEVPMDEDSDSTALSDIDCLSSEVQVTLKLNERLLGNVGSGTNSSNTNQIWQRVKRRF